MTIDNNLPNILENVKRLVNKVLELKSIVKQGQTMPPEVVEDMKKMKVRLDAFHQFVEDLMADQKKKGIPPSSKKTAAQHPLIRQMEEMQYMLRVEQIQTLVKTTNDELGKFSFLPGKQSSSNLTPEASAKKVKSKFKNMRIKNKWKQV